MSIKFDYKDIFSAVNAEEAEPYIQKFGYSGCSMKDLMDNIKINNKLILREIGGPERQHRFHVGECSLAEYFIPEEKVQRQDQLFIESVKEFCKCISCAAGKQLTVKDIVGMTIFTKTKNESGTSCCLIVAIDEDGVAFGHRYLRWRNLKDLQFSLGVDPRDTYFLFTTDQNDADNHSTVAYLKDVLDMPKSSKKA